MLDTVGGVEGLPQLQRGTGPVRAFLQATEMEGKQRGTCVSPESG